MTLPAILSGWENAKLPLLYQQARRVLSECESVDECRRWVVHAEAVKSYYRQAKDETLLDLVRRIQLRAWRRIGELVKDADTLIEDIDLPNGGHAKVGGTLLGEQSGLSRKELSAARRIALVPLAEFERMVESGGAKVSDFRYQRKTPDTRGPDRVIKHIRALAACFKKIPPSSLDGISLSPNEINFVIDCLGQLQRRNAA